MTKKNKYACFQWIRDVRAKMNKDMEHMTPEERVAYMHAGAEAALRKMPKLSIEEARRQRRAILHPEETPIPSQRKKVARSRNAKVTTKPIRQGKAANRLAHA